VKVVFLETTESGQREMGSIVLSGSQVSFSEGFPAKFRQTLERGIRYRKKIIKPSDGLPFFLACPYVFSGSYLRAKLQERS
jgi:hypothetical protein